MDERVAIREVMRREYVGVNEGDTVRDAAELMHGDGVESAIVLRGNDPVGALTPDDVLELVAGRDNPADVTVGAVMRQPVLSIEADRPVSEAVEVIVDRTARQLVVEVDGSIEGIVTARDLLTAGVVFSRRGRSDQPAGVPADVPAAESAEGPGSEEASPYAQGVCEVCGSLTAELRDVNGQLVCTDCRSV